MSCLVVGEPGTESLALRPLKADSKFIDEPFNKHTRHFDRMELTSYRIHKDGTECAMFIDNSRTGIEGHELASIPPSSRQWQAHSASTGLLSSHRCSVLG